MKAILKLREAYQLIVHSIDKEILDYQTKKTKVKPTKQLRQLSNNEWALIKEITETLEPVDIAITAIQKENITLTDIKKKIDLCYERVAQLGKTILSSLIHMFRIKSDLE